MKNQIAYTTTPKCNIEQILYCVHLPLVELKITKVICFSQNRWCVFASRCGLMIIVLFLFFEEGVYKCVWKRFEILLFIFASRIEC